MPTGYPKALGGTGIRMALTKNVGRIAGRTIPFVGWCLLAYDIGATLYNTQSTTVRSSKSKCIAYG